MTIQNISDDPVDLRYRRVLDWDVDPTPFEEFVTIDTFGSQTAPALAFSSNDGFASPDPLDGPTDRGQTGRTLQDLLRDTAVARANLAVANSLPGDRTSTHAATGQLAPAIGCARWWAAVWPERVP